MTSTPARTATRNNLPDPLTFHQDLQALSDYIDQFSGITNEDLARFNIRGHLSVIHGCVANLVSTLKEIQSSNKSSGFAGREGHGGTDISCPVELYWASIREEAKRANDLVHELAISISKVRAGLLDCEHLGDVPRDIRDLNAVLDNSLSLLAFDWDTFQKP